METITITFFVLLGLSVLFIILSRRAFKKGRQEAQQNKNHSSHRPQKTRRRNNLPNIFSEQNIIDAANHFSRRSNIEFAFDTNILIDNPYILSNIANESDIPLIISQQVRYELDRLKDHDENVGQEARIALRDISNLHKDNRLKIIYYNKKFIEEHGLRTDVADDLIIGSYLERQTENKEIIFITNDNNSRTTARTANLTPLELDWDGKKRRNKEQEFRPGHFNKVLGIIFLSLAFGLFNGAMNVEPGENVALNIYNTIKTNAKEKNTPNLIENDKYPFLVESEYEDRYLGKEIKDWGYTAILDIHNNLDISWVIITLGSWFDGDIDDKTNELYYELVTKDGHVLEEGEEIITVSYTAKAYSKQKGVHIESVDTTVKFDRITDYENLNIKFKHDFDFEKQLKGAKLVLKHKVTNDKLVTIPLKIKKHKE